MDPVFWGVVGYVLAQLALGLLVSRSIHSESEYLLAGRRFGTTMLTMTIFATWFGAETCIGASGQVYAHGLSGARMDPFGYTLCLILMGLFFAEPLWKRKFTTLADLFRQRYSGGVERLAVLLMAPTSVMWAAAQIRAFGTVLTASSDLNLTVAITISAAAVILYTASGGLMADAVTDFLQGVVLIIGLAVILAVIGFRYLNAGFPPLPAERFSMFSSATGSPLAQLESWSIPIIGSLMSQELVARVLAARTPQVARKASLLGGALYLSVGLVPVALGLMGPNLLPNLANPENFLAELAHTHLSMVLYVLFAGALISAILSTVDSALLAAGALFSHNLVLPLLNAEDEKVKLRFSRASVFVFGVIAYVMAVFAHGIHDLVVDASAFGSAGVFTVVVFGLFTRFGGVWTAYASLGAGALVYFLCNYGIEAKYPYLMSLAAALGAYVAAGLCERASNIETLPELDQAQAADEEAS